MVIASFQRIFTAYLVPLAWRTVAAPSSPILRSVGSEAKRVQVGVLEDEPDPDRLPGQ